MEDKDQKRPNSTEVINVETFTKEGKTPPKGKKYEIRVDKEHYVFDKEIVSGQEIMEKTGILHPECFWLFQKVRGRDFKRILPTDEVDLSEPGLEQFELRPTEIFQFYVDNEPETTDQKQLTPNQILDAAGLTPVVDYYLVRINDDGSQVSYKDKPEEAIEMVCPPAKFVSAFRGETPVS